MIRAQILTEWIGDGQSPETAFRPRFTDDYPSIKWMDATDRQFPNLPGLPTAIIIDAECNEVQLAEIESNPDYFVVSTE